MRAQPVFKGFINACLPARAGGFEGVHHFGREADGGGLLDRGLLRAPHAGAGWQTRIDAALKDWLKNHSPA